MLHSPFHPDELAAQARAGGGPAAAAIRDFMPDQHRTFFEALPYLMLAVPDRDGWPLATVLAGEPGFVRSPDPTMLRVGEQPQPGDPAAGLCTSGQPIGMLGIDLATRRRNRANGRIVASDPDGFTVAVEQSFGNCAQYIQRRELVAATVAPGEAEVLTSLDTEARQLVGAADTFFVASRAGSAAGASSGLDISHRGGQPGFVRIAGDTLSIPDFRGNRFFNTLGNLMGEPRASLLFVDFGRGDVLQLQGLAEIDWDRGAIDGIEGAERVWHFRCLRAWRRRGALGLRWRFVEYSPVTLRTGTWPSSAA